MDLERNVAATFPLNKEDWASKKWTICLHAFSDLTNVSPVVFLYLLKECYIYGTCKATTKFQSLQQQVFLVLHNDPQPGAGIFVLQCLYVLPVFELYSEGFSHLTLSALRRFMKKSTTHVDSLEVRDLAAKLFLDIIGGHLYHDDSIVVKVLEVFDVKLTNIEKIVSQTKSKNVSTCITTKEFVDQYILKMVESQSYLAAVTLLEHFSIRQPGEPFLLCLIQNKEYKAAEKWATFMGKPFVCLLVQEYVNRNKLKCAYEIIKKNNLKQDLPDVYQRCKGSLLKRLAEKGCWDVAEAKAKSDRQLIKNLVYMAMEAGYSEKADELCDRYALKGFLDAKVLEASVQQSQYLGPIDLLIEDIIWVDEVDGLHKATSHIERHKVVGLDCEWKPNYVKGSKPNKVSIMQLASDKVVFILDLIKLSGDVPDDLDNCLTRILQSPSILKLGYNFRCDIHQLGMSYEHFKCFKRYEMLLDIQNMFKEPHGGLSGLAEKILGAGLNKTRRNSNWELRPLTPNQLEYAALDAAVLIHIFHRGDGSHSQSFVGTEGQDKFEWKSCIITEKDVCGRNKLR